MQVSFFIVSRLRISRKACHANMFVKGLSPSITRHVMSSDSPQTLASLILYPGHTVMLQPAFLLPLGNRQPSSSLVFHLYPSWLNVGVNKLRTIKGSICVGKHPVVASTMKMNFWLDCIGILSLVRIILCEVKPLFNVIILLYHSR